MEQRTVAIPQLRKQVLYVHDEVGLLQFRKLMLERHGYQVLSATSSSEALSLFRGNEVDLIVADHLSSHDARSTMTAEMKRLRPSVPIIILSDNAVPDAGRVDAGDLYLQTPDGDELLQNVEALTQLRTNRRRLNQGEGVPLRVERQRDARKELFAAIVDSSNEAIFSKNLNGIVTSWNPASERLYGYKASEIVGKSASILVPENRRGELKGVVRQFQMEKRARHLETQRIAKDGTLLNVSLSVSPVHDPQGRLIGLSVTAHDASRQKNVEEALRASEKLATAGRLAATVAHEINNPLEVLSNILYLLELNPSLDEAGREYLRAGEEELRRVIEIARLTLNFHRDRGTHLSPVILPDVLDTVMNLYDRKIKNARIKVERRYRTREAVEAIAGELRQVVSNLMANAVDAVTGSGNRLLVRIALACVPGRVRVAGIRMTIADNGSGIPRSEMQHLFQPFFTTKGEHGTGIGLWVSRGIIEKHGGCIRVRSRNTGQHHGTIFQVFLPLMQS